MSDATPQKRPVTERREGLRVVLLLCLFLAELAVLAVTYQFFVSIECHQTGWMPLCRFLRSLVARAMVVFAAALLLYWARPQPFREFLAAGATAAPRRLWQMVHAIGLILLIAPALLSDGHELTGVFATIAPFLAGGSILAAVGALMWIAPAPAWQKLLLQDRGAPLVVLAVAAILPDIADLVRPLWAWHPLTALTFAGVELFLSLFPGEIRADAFEFVIGLDGFLVHISEQCSGVEGIALVTAFTAIYAFIFRKSLHLKRYFITVLPIAIILSWFLNVLRAGTLIVIGAHVSPHLAANGFHSHAGWLFFTALALLLVVAAQSLSWLHKDNALPGSSLPALRDDPFAAAFLPFIAFLTASLLTQAIFEVPEIGYPLRVIVLLVVVAYFWPQVRRLSVSADPVALTAGALVGMGWLVFDHAPAGSGSELRNALSALSAGWLVVWMCMRVLGTAALVPLVEEMFFRGYLLRRLDTGGAAMRVVAVAVSSVLFAALHGRWLAAGGAGVIFALVMLRRGKVGDAVLAHAVANLLIAAYAIYTGDFSRI